MIGLGLRIPEVAMRGRKLVPSGQPGFSPFILTAGNIFDVYPGYVKAGAMGNPEAIGSVEPQPHSDIVMAAFAFAGSEGWTCQFEGDHVATFSGIVLFIDGTRLGRLSEPVYSAETNLTSISYNSDPQVIGEVGGVYDCSFSIELG